MVEFLKNPPFHQKDQINLVNSDGMYGVEKIDVNDFENLYDVIDYLGDTHRIDPNSIHFESVYDELLNVNLLRFFNFSMKHNDLFWYTEE